MRMICVQFLWSSPFQWEGYACMCMSMLMIDRTVSDEILVSEWRLWEYEWIFGFFWKFLVSARGLSFGWNFLFRQENSVWNEVWDRIKTHRFSERVLFDEISCFGRRIMNEILYFGRKYVHTCLENFLFQQESSLMKRHVLARESGMKFFVSAVNLCMQWCMFELFRQERLSLKTSCFGRRVGNKIFCFRRKSMHAMMYAWKTSHFSERVLLGNFLFRYESYGWHFMFWQKIYVCK